jgi:hypothetical protein
MVKHERHPKAGGLLSGKASDSFDSQFGPEPYWNIIQMIPYMWIANLLMA